MAFPALARLTYAHNNFTSPPLVNIFLTTPNALFTTTTKNFLFLLEVALFFIFLLLKRLSLNLLISFCTNKKSSSTLWKFLHLFSLWIGYLFSANENSAFLFIIKFGFISALFWKFSLKSVRWKALGRKIFYFKPSSNFVPPNVYSNIVFRLKFFISIVQYYRDMIEF